MPYNHETQEQLKALICKGEKNEFQKILKKTYADDYEAAAEYLNGNHDEGRGLLYWAASKRGNRELIEDLISMGANVEHPNGSHGTAIFASVNVGCGGNTHMLVKHHANVNSVDLDNNTPLHIAARNSGAKVEGLIELFCNSGANILAQNNQGATPLHIAAQNSLKAYALSHLEIWKDQKIVREIMIFLQSHGVGTTRATRIFKTYGEEAIAVVSKDPYQLAKDIRGSRYNCL